MYKSNNTNKCREYVAPVLGNGEICFQSDYEGCMSKRSEKITHNPNMKIWRAGRRRPDGTLLPFGAFNHKFDGADKIKKYTQELDVKKAVSKTECVCENGIAIISETAVHHDYSLIMIHRKIKCTRAFTYCFEYCLDNLKNDFSEHTVSAGDCIDIKYSTFGGQKGNICVFSDKAAEAEASGGICTLGRRIPAGETDIVFYILFCDSINSESYNEKTEEIKERVLNEGFEKLMRQHSDKWEEYYGEGYVITDDSRINEVYNTAQYHLKCFTTPWSVPVGLCDELWQGRYFAFDEFYMLMPLLGSNHMAAARRPPHFRACGLEKAIKRASSPHGVQQARYPWETLENGSEGTSPGYWRDHVFHMACIAMTEYYYYKYTQDKQFLREEGYPVIHACAMFYINHMLYEAADGKLKAAKCTDLERLGASVPNGYMTMCAVIKTIKIFCEAADILGLEDADGYSELADRLIASLPNDGIKYIPYDGCTETSVGLMGGIYPYDVIDKDNKMQRRGIDFYFANENKTGNMYAVGSGVCPWYKLWKAVVLGRLGETEAAYRAVKSAAGDTGNFNEMYEINDRETDTVFRPWFGTAAGMFIQAVNEMFVRYEDGLIYIGAGLPAEIKDFSCRLAVPGGIAVNAEVRNGCIARLMLTGNEEAKNIYVAVPGRLLLEKLNGVVIKERSEKYLIIQCDGGIEYADRKTSKSCEGL